jgi:flagellar biosynthetic protein FliR
MGLALENAALFGLSASRIAGFVVVSPFPGKNVGVTQRIGLVVVLSWLTCAFAAKPGSAKLGLELAWCAIPEVLCGLLMGMAFHFVFAAADILGGVLGQMTGLGSPSVLNPTIEASETPLARIVSLAAMLVALSMGAHRIALAALLESFRAIPLGTAMSLDSPIVRYFDLATTSFVVGVQLAMPVVAVAIVVHVALAMISRAAPSLQIFSVGFAVIFASTGATLLSSLTDVFQGLAAHFGSLASALDLILTDLRP